MKKTRDGVGRTFFWRSKPRACLVRPALGSCSPEKRKKKKTICFTQHGVKYGLEEFLDYFFWPFFRGGGVLREGWDAVYKYWGRGGRWCYYLGRGEKGRKGLTTRGGAGGGCNGKHFWLMELLLDRTTYLIGFSTDFVCVKSFALGRGVSSFFCHASAKLSS